MPRLPPIFHFLSHCRAKKSHSAQEGSQFLIPIRDIPPSLPKNFYPLSDEKKTPGEKSSLLHRIGPGRRFPILKWREILREYGAHPLSHSGKYKTFHVRGKYHFVLLHKAGILNPPSPHLALDYIPVLYSRRWNGNCCIMLFCHHPPPPPPPRLIF